MYLSYGGGIIFYSLSLTFLFYLTGVSNIRLYSIIKAFMPVVLGEWWFASCYFLLFLLHPFLNIIIREINCDIYQRLLVFIISCWCLIPTFLPTQFYCNSLIWFISLYFLAGYIRLYQDDFSRYSSKQLLCFSVISMIITYSLSVFVVVISAKYTFLSKYSYHFFEQNALTTLLSSVSLFLGMLKCKISYNLWINLIASATFGVYLIHDHQLVRPYLWKTIFHNADFQDSITIIPYSIIVCFLVYIVCTIIELLRQKTIERIYLRMIDKFLETHL